MKNWESRQPQPRGTRGRGSRWTAAEARSARLDRARPRHTSSTSRRTRTRRHSVGRSWGAR